MNFFDLQLSTQDELKDRFTRYGIDAQYMYDETNFFSQEMKSLPESEFLDVFDMKHISHIYPRSKFPDLAGDPTNIFLEDEFENISRGSNIVMPEEIQAAYVDQIEDINDFDINDDGFIDLSSFQNEFDSLLDFDSWDYNFYDYII